jgi:hypothetical protein
MSRRHFDRSVFDAHLIRETEDGTRLSLRFLQHEEQELDRLAEDEFRANYQRDYKNACAQAEAKWYPYRVAGIFDGQLNDLYERSEIDSVIKKRWSELRNQTKERHVKAILSEVNKAFERRAMLEPAYETEWGFRVKSKGEKEVANALRFYTFTDQSTGECNRVTLLYEPLFRIPEENRVIIPDFVVPEYCLIIEFAGFAERNYQFGLFMKIEAVRKLGFPIVIIKPEDLNDLEKLLHQKLKFYFNLAVSQTKPF